MTRYDTHRLSINRHKTEMDSYERKEDYMKTNFQGIPASSGIAIAKAYKLKVPNLSYTHKTFTDSEMEIQRFENALKQSKQDLKCIRESIRRKLGDDSADIFSAHLLILSDPTLIVPTKERIIHKRLIAEEALDQTRTLLIEMFERMDNRYMKERALDVQDVTNRVIAHLLGVDFPSLAFINEEVIIIANDLTPSETAQFDRKFVKGFVTDRGGATSHSAIIARSLNIPAIVGARDLTHYVSEGSLIMIDGHTGKIKINPSDNDLRMYRREKKMREQQNKKWTVLKDEPTWTEDGQRVKIAGNIGALEDVQAVVESGGEGIGLFRTEFLFMEKNQLPSEEEQFTAYRFVLEKMGHKPVSIRTLDIGGDKELNYLHMPEELNPFLGVRAIRFCLKHETIFRTQLRALLRASMYGQLKIMFPMVATIEEFRQAKALLVEEKKRLIQDGVDVATNIKVGIMVEIPATAIMARQFAKEVDFFSIGTNDLIQYTMAADRLNERVSHLYQPYHPAHLFLISNIIDAARQEEKAVSMCGEMASDPLAIPILLGLGLHELSMNPSSILSARSQIQGLSQSQITSVKHDLLSMHTAEEVLQYMKENNFE